MTVMPGGKDGVYAGIRDLFRTVIIGGKRCFTSSNIAAPHVFTTRDGGSGGFDENSIVRVNQWHSALVFEVPDGAPGGALGEGDALVTRGYSPIRVKTADCVPILYSGEDLTSDAGGAVHIVGTENIVGAAHAGWRGTAAGIAAATLAAMERRGAEPSRVQIAIGAAIHSCCYGVREDFRDAIAAAAGSDAAGRFISERGGVLYADIIGLNLMFLLEAGAKPENISVSRLCTCCDTELFYSNRAEGGVKGSMLAIIRRSAPRSALSAPM